MNQFSVPSYKYSSEIFKGTLNTDSCPHFQNPCKYVISPHQNFYFFQSRTKYEFRPLTTHTLHTNLLSSWRVPLQISLFMSRTKSTGHFPFSSQQTQRRRNLLFSLSFATMACNIHRSTEPLLFSERTYMLTARKGKICDTSGRRS